MPGEDSSDDGAGSNWTMSTFCATGNCIAVNLGEVIRIRDNRSPDGLELAVDRHEWRAFIAGVKAGEFDV